MKNALLAAALLLTACGRPQTIPQENIQVQVTSTPATGKLFLAGKPLGDTPQTVTVASLDALLELSATCPREEVVEKRIQILGKDRAEVTFVFGTSPTATGKALGLARVLVFDYGAGVTFELNKAELQPDFKPLLDRQAALLKSHFSGLDVYVCGHTDALGTQDFNLSLSLARARCVASYLETLGAPRERFKVQGFGSAYPVAPNQTETGRARNRRTELVLPQ